MSTEDLCAVLQVTIEEHHRCFIAEYSADAIIPKFHFLLHYPRQIIKVGPMIRTWNMRNEAKLNVFKQASRLGNFKNIASSIANRHQRLLCYELSTHQLLWSPLECGPCDPPMPIENMPVHIQESLKSILPTLSYETEVVHPKWVKCLGRTIKINGYVVRGSDGLHPTFGKIIDILVLVDIVVLHISHYNVEYFDNHFHSYAITPSVDQSYLCFSELSVSTILHAHRIDNVLYIYLKEYFPCSVELLFIF